MVGVGVGVLTVGGVGVGVGVGVVATLQDTELVLAVKRQRLPSEVAAHE
jgi:hypothetical protein